MRTVVMNAVAAVELLCKADELGDSGPSLGSSPVCFARYSEISVASVQVRILVWSKESILTRGNFA